MSKITQQINHCGQCDNFSYIPMVGDGKCRKTGRWLFAGVTGKEYNQIKKDGFPKWCPLDEGR